MTREQLMTMPISRIKALDIRDKEMETLVQSVLDEKTKDEIYLDPNRIVLSSSETDHLTPEKERELQAKIDASGSESGEIADEPSASQPVPTVEPETVTSTRFCEQCDSKGVRHKKVCPTLKVTGTQNV